jgi:hypothetical protein
MNIHELIVLNGAFRQLNESDSELWWYSEQNKAHYLLDDMSFNIEHETHNCRVMAIILDNEIASYIMDFDENMYLVSESDKFTVNRVIDDQMTRIFKHLLDKGIIREEYKGCYYPNNHDYKLLVYDADCWGYEEINHIIDDGGVYYGIYNDGGINTKIPLSIVNMKVRQTVDIDLTVI